MTPCLSRLKLNPRQAEILSFLARHPGRKFSAKDIANSIDWRTWNDYPTPSQQNVIRHIYLLKQQCREAGVDIILKRPGKPSKTHGYSYQGVRRRA